MKKTCETCLLAHLHDYDGEPVARRLALESENAKLRSQVETLARALRRQQMINAGVPAAPARVLH
ncbi:hypothetical protein [Magnetospirillum molischianum]|uniref:Uncharacterized protein n=1 Tax=Magnetospirillum molischianum DSM 120 TaxID=1150626 RepID=H8FY29_MAGML|nr:hypothetical protein [Magnetospirillum molischianum]CCG43267.1 hypothetical protein PHAMO_80058 [Magnetospirillum molischianum DSM 120]